MGGSRGYPSDAWAPPLFWTSFFIKSELTVKTPRDDALLQFFFRYKSVESAEVDDHQFLLLTQDCFLTQHILEPIRGGNVLDLILSSQNELVDNVKVHKSFGSSDHNQIHFNIKVKTGNTYKIQWRRNFNKGKYKKMRTYLTTID